MEVQPPNSLTRLLAEGFTSFARECLHLAVHDLGWLSTVEMWGDRQTERERYRKTESEEGDGREWGRNHWLWWPTSQSYTPSLLFTKFRERERICSVVSDSLRLHDCSLPGSSIHGILQARVLEWVAISSQGDLPDPGIDPSSPTLQTDALPSEPLGMLRFLKIHRRK